MNGHHSGGHEGDRELSDIVGADNTLPPYSASTRGWLNFLQAQTLQYSPMGGEAALHLMVYKN